jgi:hypothetical protein
MKSLAGLSLFLYIFSPVLGLYIDPAILKDIRVARVAEQYGGKYHDASTGGSKKIESETGLSHDNKLHYLHEHDLLERRKGDFDTEEAFSKRGKVDKFMIRLGTSGGRKAVRFAKHNPKTATVLVGAIATKTAYELLKPDEDDHRKKGGTIVYVNNPARPPISKRDSQRSQPLEIVDEQGEEDDNSSSLQKRAGPVDSFMGKNIKKGALGAKKFAKSNPYTATIVGGALLTAGAVKVYNLVKGDDSHTQVIHLVSPPAHSRMVKRRLEDTVDSDRRNEKGAELAKRGMVNKLKDGLWETKVFARSNKLLLTEAALVVAGIGLDVRYHNKKKHEKKEMKRKAEEDKKKIDEEKKRLEEERKKLEEEKKAVTGKLVKRSLPDIDEATRPETSQLRELEGEESVLEKRGSSLSYSQRAKAFAKTKKGKMIIGGMAVKSALTLGFLYHMTHRNQTQSCRTYKTYKCKASDLSSPKFVSSNGQSSTSSSSVTAPIVKQNDSDL